MSAENDVKIDVLMPTFNAARTIESAVASIQRQTFRAIRILIVDDGSTDLTPRILARLATADPRLLIIRQKNRGVVAALNSGLARCRAEFVARHDADDIAAPERLAIQLDWLAGHPECVAVSGAARHIDGNGSFLGTVARLSSPDGADAAWVPAREPYLIHPFLLARRAALNAVGGYRYALHAEDSDLYWRLQEIGTLHNLEEVLGDYRMHEASISSASLHNGRIMAIESQRAAISAIRRRRGERDLAFPAEAAARLRAARSLAELLDIGREGLSAAEVLHFDAAVAAKLLELAAYRPYELQLEDCRFIRAGLHPTLHRLSSANRIQLSKMWAGTAARLLHLGEIQRARALAPLRAYPSTLSRLALRLAMPPRLRTRLKEALSGARQQLQVK